MIVSEPSEYKGGSSANCPSRILKVRSEKRTGVGVFGKGFDGSRTNVVVGVLEEREESLVGV